MSGQTPLFSVEKATSSLLGRNVRKPRQAARRIPMIELLEDRNLLTSTGLTLLDDLADCEECAVSEAHYALAPDASTAGVQAATEEEPGEVGLFSVDSRWGTTATDGFGLQQGDPTTITWSIVTDGTPIPKLGGMSLPNESSDPSSLIAALSNVYGVVTDDADYTDETWFPVFQSVFDRWSELSGVTYVYEPNDDGAAFSNVNVSPGVLGTRGDVRIGGHFITGASGTVGYNFFPDIGDMVLDTADFTEFNGYFTNTSNNSIRLRNTLAHEFGHGLGLEHVGSSDAAFLMEPTITTTFDGPQYDDILGVHRSYGDVFEKGLNNDTGNATPLGALAAGATLTVGADATTTVVLPSQTDFVSVDDESDVDVFSFTVSGATTIDLTLTPVGPTYNLGTSFNASAQSDLALELIDADGSTVLATASSNGIGAAETITNFSLSSAGTYYVRVTGSTTDKVQTYQLDVVDNSVPMDNLAVSIDPSSVSEGAGAAAATGTVTRDDANLSSSLVVMLSSDDTSEATVPMSVTIMAGQSSADFDIDAVNDALFDGTQTVTITASADGHNNGSETLDVTDEESPELTLTINAASFSEAAGLAATTATVTRNDEDLSSPLTVMLNSNDAGEATVPSTVTIQSGQSSATFDIDAVNDAVVDGTQTVTISASATGYTGDSDTVDVTDDDVLTLTVTIAADSFGEDDGPAATTAVVTRNDANLDSPLVVNLSSNDTGEATVPSTVTILMGQSSAMFDIDAVDDGALDGTQTVTISVSAGGYVGDSDTVDVTDNETPTLTVTINAASFSEGAGAAATTATVTRNGDLTSPLVVTLSSNDSGEATVPLTATILADQPSATFDIDAVNDAIVDGTQTVTISASATGYDGGSDTVNVTDDDVLTLTLSVTPGVFSENAGSAAAVGTVTRNDGNVSSPLTVNLFSDDVGEATVPVSVTILAGQTSATFDVDAVDDVIIDGSQTVTISGSASGYVGDADSISVTDFEVPNRIVTGRKGTRIIVRNAPDFSQHLNFLAYPGFSGQVRVAIGDVTGDGVGDVITGPGPGGGPHIKIFDGVNGQLHRQFFAFGSGFRGGVFVAAGDVNNDGFADVIVGAGPNAGPHVRVFSGADNSLLKNFFAYGSGFRGGVQVAAGDVNNDGFADVVTAPGSGGGPHVKVFSGTNQTLLASFFAYSTTFRGGVFVATGDVNNDGNDDVVTAPLKGGPHVRAFSGSDQSILANFFAYETNFTGGVRVATSDVDGDGTAEIVAAPGPGRPPAVRAFETNGSLSASFAAYVWSYRDGVFIDGTSNSVPAGGSSPQAATAANAPPDPARRFARATVAAMNAFGALSEASVQSDDVVLLFDSQASGTGIASRRSALNASSIDELMAGSSLEPTTFESSDVDPTATPLGARRRGGGSRQADAEAEPSGPVLPDVEGVAAEGLARIEQLLGVELESLRAVIDALLSGP